MGAKLPPVEKPWCMTYLCLERCRPCLSGKLLKSFLILNSGCSSVIPRALRADLVKATVLPFCVFLSAPLPLSHTGSVPERGTCLCISVSPISNVHCAWKAGPTRVKPRGPHTRPRKRMPYYQERPCPHTSVKPRAGLGFTWTPKPSSVPLA